MPLRTAQRWVSRYRRFGLAGLSRAARADQGKRRRLSDELRRLAEGLALQMPPLGPGAIYREVGRLAQAEGQEPPSYYTIYNVINVTRALPEVPTTSRLTARRPTATPTTWFTAARRSARTKYGKPVTRGSISGPDVTTLGWGSRG